MLMKPSNAGDAGAEQFMDHRAFAEGADVYMINTCTVTNMADRKSNRCSTEPEK